MAKSAVITGEPGDIYVYASSYHHIRSMARSLIISFMRAYGYARVRARVREGRCAGLAISPRSCYWACPMVKRRAGTLHLIVVKTHTERQVVRRLRECGI